MRPTPGRRSLGRLRPRLTVTLAAVAALTAVAVAVSSYVAVRELRLRRETDAAVAQTQFNLAFAAEALGPGATGADVEAVVQALQRRGGFDIVAATGERTYQTSVSISGEAVPADLERLVEGGRVAAARRSVAGRPYVVTGGSLQPDGDQLWFFFPLDALYDDLDSLRRVLAVSASAMVALSAVVGVVAARSLLRPIGRARDAAQQMAAGQLSTRLPADGSDEFAELSRSFNAMAAALERTVGELRELEAGHRRFVADVSHELRTPVTALATAADVLEPRLPALPERERRVTAVLVEESLRLRHLVEDLMEISRLDAGAAVIDDDLVDVRRLLLGTVAQHGWDDRVRTDDLERVVVRGDRRRLDRVLTNLVDNALQHGRPPVEVRAWQGDGTAVVEVRDHGPGIPPEHLPHVFDRFYKADPARRRSTGSGLGLAIARDNVALHGGTIEAENDPAGGARFRVVLPLAAVAEPLPDGEGPARHGADDERAPKPSPRGTPR